MENLQNALDNAMMAVAFDFSDWHTGEEKIVSLLKDQGWKNPYFYMIECDSFGPLVRGLRASGQKAIYA